MCVVRDWVSWRSRLEQKRKLVNPKIELGQAFCGLNTAQETNQHDTHLVRIECLILSGLDRAIFLRLTRGEDTRTVQYQDVIIISL